MNVQIKQEDEDEQKKVKGGYEGEQGVMGPRGCRANEIQFLQHASLCW